MAKWIKAISRNPMTRYGNAYRSCSNCGEAQYMPLKFRYCSMCGTEMEKPKSYNYNDFFDENECFGIEYPRYYIIAYSFCDNMWVISNQRDFAYKYNERFDTEYDAYQYFVKNKNKFLRLTAELSGEKHSFILYKGEFKPTWNM